MNQVRLGPDRQVEDSSSVLIAHERQIEFHGQEWMLSKDMPPTQALMHREQYTKHAAAYDALVTMTTTGAGAEIIPFPAGYTSQQSAAVHVAA